MIPDEFAVGDDVVIRGKVASVTKFGIYLGAPSRVVRIDREDATVRVQPGAATRNDISVETGPVDPRSLRLRDHVRSEWTANGCDFTCEGFVVSPVNEHGIIEIGMTTLLAARRTWFLVKRAPEPEYVVGRCYEAADGKLLYRVLADDGSALWHENNSGCVYADDMPARPLRPYRWQP